ncbi:unnamed protein product [Ophioblennius macclurei]
MASREQKTLWRLVHDGNPLKLKSFLKKNRDVDVNFSRGKRRRSPLHLACSLGDDGAVRLLLRRGADVLRRDERGNTALHDAANRALEHGYTAYEDLVVPLMRSCPEALEAQNTAGVTPQDLLKWIKQSKRTEEMNSSFESDAEKEWQRKLFAECEDESYETFASDFPPLDDDEADFDDWFEQVRREYLDKRLAEAQRLTSMFSSWRKRKSEEEKKEEEARRNKKLFEELQKEHQEYLARAMRKDEETRRGKKRRYDEACAATFNASSSSDGAKLSYDDIPWPAPRGTVQDMLDVMLHGVDRKDATAFRKALRKQQALWHPDKFAQRCEARLQEKDKRRILDTVTALSQELNKLAQSLRN